MLEELLLLLLKSLDLILQSNLFGHDTSDLTASAPMIVATGSFGLEAWLLLGLWELEVGVFLIERTAEVVGLSFPSKSEAWGKLRSSTGRKRFV